MYDTLVNMNRAARPGRELELRALPGAKNTWVDNVSAFGSGFGGEPYSFARLNASKGKAYEFSGVFRRDRQYMDYNLLGNPNIPGGQTIPIGPSSAPTGKFAYPQVLDSPFLFNTVRRMTDTNLTLRPLSVFTYRFGYSQNVMEGPSNSPSGYQIASSHDLLLREYQRNSTDDFFGALDWKPTQTTKISFEEQVDHYKGNSYFTLDPAYLMVQEADGTPVALCRTTTPCPPTRPPVAIPPPWAAIPCSPRNRAQACRSSTRPARWHPAICAPSQPGFSFPLRSFASRVPPSRTWP